MPQTDMKMPEPAPNTKSAFRSPAIPVIRGKGDLTYRCRSCNTNLVENMNYKEAEGTVVECPKCSTFNEIPTARRTS
jgi:phage FluMu protein Com